MTEQSPAYQPSRACTVFSSCDAIWREVNNERVRAHNKHGDTSMESLPVTDLTRFTVLAEEVGEVARAFNEARHSGGFDAERLSDLREELIQVAAMSGAWADALTPRQNTASQPPEEGSP